MKTLIISEGGMNKSENESESKSMNVWMNGF